MITVLLWLCVLPPTFALLYFSIEVALGLRAVRARTAERDETDVVVVIPAHDEALAIADTVQSVFLASPSPPLVLVVADNCSDETAELARAAGAIVVERNDPARRGKGHALAFARDSLAEAPPAAVFILDADCRIQRGSPALAAGEAIARGEPVQSRNLLSAPADAPPLVRLSNFAFLLKNLVRARGTYRLGGGVTLFGTGMAFPWSVFAGADLATSEAVEDLKLSVELAMEGKKVHLSEATQVTSPAASAAGTVGQRRRWEHGFLANASKTALPLLMNGARLRSRHLAVLGAHLLVPPLALLFLVSSFGLLLALVGILWGLTPGPAIVLLVGLICAVAAVTLAWYREGRLILGAQVFLRAPVYILWKMPLYIGFFFARQTDWNRTERPNEKS